MFYMNGSWIEACTVECLRLGVLAGLCEGSGITSCCTAFFVGFTANLSSSLVAFGVTGVSTPVTSGNGIQNWTSQILNYWTVLAILPSPPAWARYFAALFFYSSADIEVSGFTGLITSTIRSSNPWVLKDFMVLCSGVLVADKIVLLC